MFTHQVLRTAAGVAIGLAAIAGSAAAQSSPDEPEPTPTTPTTTDTDDTTGTTTTPAPSPGSPAPTSTDVDVDIAPPPPAPMDPPPQTNVYVSPAPMQAREDEDSTLERYGVALSLGGGVSGFTSDTLRSTVNDGGNWGVRLSVGTRMPIGFEAAYIGSAQGLDALGLDDSALLVGNGVQGNVRVNLLDTNVQPFVFGGVAWRRYSLTNTDTNTSDVIESDDVLEVPVGAGIAWKYRGIMLDARGEFRYADQEDLVPEFADDGELDGRGTMHRYGANVNAGIAF